MRASLATDSGEGQGACSVHCSTQHGRTVLESSKAAPEQRVETSVGGPEGPSFSSIPLFSTRPETPLGPRDGDGHESSSTSNHRERVEILSTPPTPFPLSVLHGGLGIVIIVSKRPLLPPSFLRHAGMRLLIGICAEALIETDSRRPGDRDACCPIAPLVPPSPARKGV